jgi:hypothetical protein
MNDKELGKKTVEQEELNLFLDAHKYATGQRLAVVGCGEPPDFICARLDGTHVGVELTRGDGDLKVMESIQQDQGEPRFGYSAFEEMVWRIDEKERPRRGDWTLPGNSILVVQTFFFPVADLEEWLTPDLQADFGSYGFTEIWLADHTTVEPYGGVELFGLKPVKWWGYHPREDFAGKPYG